MKHEGEETDNHCVPLVVSFYSVQEPGDENMKTKAFYVLYYTIIEEVLLC